ncbi:hypothetical protein KAR91_15230 [Candidatus Pacearchaeota archaeon]|nr:hypothetical protein [Candidatus Pacearchaeota archaeon]
MNEKTIMILSALQKPLDDLFKSEEYGAISLNGFTVSYDNKREKLDLKVDAVVKNIINIVSMDVEFKI